MSQSLKYSDEHWFDPNAAGMACLLGGLFVLGLASDMMLDGSEDRLAKSIAYSGLTLLVLSILLFLFAFVRMLTYKEEEHWPLIVKTPPSSLEGSFEKEKLSQKIGSGKVLHV